MRAPPMRADLEDVPPTVAEIEEQAIYAAAGVAALLAQLEFFLSHVTREAAREVASELHARVCNSLRLFMTSTRAK